MAKTGRPLDSVRHRYQRILEESGAYERFHKILKQTPNDQNFIKAFDLANDRAWGKAEQTIEMTQYDGDRPTAETLINTITALRAELDNLRKGVELEAGK